MLDKWDSYAPQFQNILQNQFKQTLFKTGWCDEIEAMLFLLKLLPSVQVGRNLIASNTTFNKAVAKLIDFMPVEKQINT